MEWFFLTSTFLPYQWWEGRTSYSQTIAVMYALDATAMSWNVTTTNPDGSTATAIWNNDLTDAQSAARMTLLAAGWTGI